MSDNYLIFDLGASNGRAVVGQFFGDRFEFDIIHRFDNRPVSANHGEYFWDVLRLLSEIKLGIQKSQKKYGSCKSMAIDTWGCDFGMLDQQGRLLGNPNTYRDPKRYDYSAQLHEILPEAELFQLSGGPSTRIMGMYQLYALMREKATEYREAHTLLMMPDLFNYFLTGEMANEFTNATMTLMANQKTRQWEPAIFEKLGLRNDFLLPLVEPGYKLGKLSPAVCRELGVEAIPVIVTATHDTASAVAGIPVTDNARKWGFISLGTWCIAGLETDKPILDPRVVDINCGNEGGVSGKNMLLRNITGLWILQQSRNKWNKEQGEEIDWDYIDMLAEKAKTQNSIIDVDDSRFGEYQEDMPGVVAEFCRQTGQDVPETIGETTQCILKSLVLKFKASFSDMSTVTEGEFELLHLVGGGTKNKLLCRWTAEAMGIPVIAGPTETTSVGNLIFQLIADGKISNVSEGRQLCKNSYAMDEYAPANSSVWDSAYQHYKVITDTRR